jgi:hypothetical protein
MSLDLTDTMDFDTSVKLALYGITAESGRTLLSLRSSSA